ncbi:thiopeptide maturation pyridine synthase [Streptomyces sp. NPDC058369]|uniref:thiopeptide maturation pyridine synthase n=1 Tax=unclassified Streptomyces TaxID=2593676 RepID=UPI0036687EC4
MMWRSFHVHYYEQDRNALLLDAVRPFVERIAPQVNGVHYLLHWLRGPHVRLHVDAAPEVFDSLVLPALDELVRGHLAARPSTAVVDTAAMLAQHERLAGLEHEAGPLSPLLPDNTVHEAPYDRRLHVHGGPQAADLLADFYNETTPFAFEMIERLRGGAQLAGLAFDTMIASAHGLSGVELRQGFVSFRSHAEAFLSWWPEAEGLREAWDRHYAAHSGLLATRVRAVLRSVEAAEKAPGAGGSGLVPRWLAAAAPVLRRGRALIAAGDLSMDPPWAGRTSLDDPEVAELARRSTFHNHRRPEGVEVDRLWFDQYRLTLNYTYLHLTRLGLSPVERFLLCHLAANTAEDLYGVPATGVLLPAPGEPVFS